MKSIVLSVALLGFAACAWPPTLPSAANAPNPSQVADQAAGATNQTTGAVEQTAGQTVNAVSQSVPAVQVPMATMPRLGGGGLLRR